MCGDNNISFHLGCVVTRHQKASYNNKRFLHAQCVWNICWHGFKSKRWVDGCDSHRNTFPLADPNWLAQGLGGPGKDQTFSEKCYHSAILLNEFLSSNITPRPKNGKLRLNLHGTYFGGKINWLGPKKTMLKGELLIWRTKDQAKHQGTVQLKDSICFKLIQIGSVALGWSLELWGLIFYWSLLTHR